MRGFCIEVVFRLLENKLWYLLFINDSKESLDSAVDWIVEFLNDVVFFLVTSTFTKRNWRRQRTNISGLWNVHMRKYNEAGGRKLHRWSSSRWAHPNRFQIKDSFLTLKAFTCGVYVESCLKVIQQCQYWPHKHYTACNLEMRNKKSRMTFIALIHHVVLSV